MPQDEKPSLKPLAETPGFLLALLTAEEAAREQNLSVPTFMKLVKNGEIAPQIIGTRRRFPRWALFTWQAKSQKINDVSEVFRFFNLANPM